MLSSFQIYLKYEFFKKIINLLLNTKSDSQSISQYQEWATTNTVKERIYA